MRSVADRLREEDRAALAALTAAERVALAARFLADVQDLASLRSTLGALASS